MATDYSDRVTRAEILDRVIDKGFVIDATYRVDVLGVELSVIDTRVTVASLDRYRELREMGVWASLSGPLPSWFHGGE